MARQGTYLLVLAIIGLSLFVAGCQGQLSTIKPTPTSEDEAATAEAMLPTETEVPPTLEPTVEPPTVQPTETPTPVPPSSTPTEPPTATPLPSATPTDPVLNMTATANAEATVMAQIEAALQATLDAQPTATEPPPTPEPSATAGPDVEATTQYSLTQQAVLNAVIADAVEATLEAQPTSTEPPTYTPYPTFTAVPSNTLAPTEQPTTAATADVRATARAEATTQAERENAFEAAVEQTLTAFPTATIVPTRETQLTATQILLNATATADALAQAEAESALVAAVEQTLTAYPTATVVPTRETQLTATQILLNATATAEALAQAEAESTLVAVVEQTLTAYPTATLEPTEAPSVTPTVVPTRETQLTATQILLNATATAEALAQVELENMIAAAVESTLAAMPSDTPVPSSTPLPTATATHTPSPAPTATPTEPPTATLEPTVTPLPTETPLPPTQAITLEPSPSGPTPDLFATATAQVVTATVVPTRETELTATQIILNAMATADARATATQNSLTMATYEAAATASAEAALTMVTAAPLAPTLDYAATATQAVAQATAVAQEPILANLGLAFAVPEDWAAPLVLDAHRLYLTDDVAQIFVYRGDSAYFAAEDWGIDPAETDLEAAANAVAEAREGTVGTAGDTGAIPVRLESQNGLQGAFYLAQLPGGEWVILSLSAPEDVFDGYDADVAMPLIQSVEMATGDEPLATAVATLPTVTQRAMDATPTVPTVQVTATDVPPTLSPFQLTATQIIFDATQIAEEYVSPTARPSATTAPTRTLTPTPTATITPDFPATATLAVASATAEAGALAAQVPDLPVEVPAGWDGPQRTDDNTLYLTDDTAKLFVSSGDAAFFADRWGIPESETQILRAAAAVEQQTGGQQDAYDEELQMVTVVVPGDATNGAVYLIAQGAGGWLVISASAPVDDFESYRVDVFDPFANALAAALAEAGPTGDDPGGEVFHPSDVTLTAYSSDTLGLAFDVPDGWTEAIDEEFSSPDMGMQAVLFFADAADAEDPGDTPVGPALAVLRFNDTEFLLTGGVQTPADLIVQMLDVDADRVKPYDATDYPAARALLDEEMMAGALYALQVDETDWVLVLLVLPAPDNVPLWDEVVVMPVVQSLVVQAPLASP